ncbi:fumarylacetoacetate hydrolase family protein [Streptomyces sp. NPDC000618]|uniref:fumarylacetoacetate hydrolase family protein n=1 Tax=Streptomyces sp. NPDC000618 TaxID=3154265 RepID=UPI00332561C0
MKLVRIHGAGTGLVAGPAGGEVVVDIARGLDELRRRERTLVETLEPYFPQGGGSWLPLIERWQGVRDHVRALVDVLGVGQHTPSAVQPLAAVRLDPPLPDPGVRIFALGGNFPLHVSGMDGGGAMVLPDSVRQGVAGGVPPWGFYVIPGTVVGQDAVVTPPPGTQKLDYEAEVAVVLGGGEHEPGSDRIDVWGFTAWNDFSIRDAALGLSKTDHGPLTWSLTKNFRTGNSCGPFMVVDEPIPEDGLGIMCKVNGEVRQDGSTSGMQYSFGATAAHVSEYAPLAGGDMILSGTPGGTAMEQGLDGPYLKDGDLVEVLIEGAGTLRNRVALKG